MEILLKPIVLFMTKLVCIIVAYAIVYLLVYMTTFHSGEPVSKVRHVIFAVITLLIGLSTFTDVIIWKWE